MTRFGPHRREERLAGILQRTLQRSGMARRLPRQVPASVWESAVGAQLAARAQPTVLSAGTLHVLVQDHRWRDQIDAVRAVVLEKLNRKLGTNAVRALQFGLAHEGALEEARRRARLCPLARHAPVAAERVAGAARLDPALREALLRAAGAALRRRP